MTSFLRLLPTSLCICLLAACDAPPGEMEPPLETQASAAGNDGFHTQGTQLHGTTVRSVSYSGASVLHEGTYRSATLKLLRGELGANMPLRVSGTTSSLQACSGFYALGATRSCGLKVEGQGVCTPGTPVSLTSGACGSEPGSCIGNPVMRVCSGERPCEHNGTGFLASGDDATACVSSCPGASFTCPASGIYTVLAGAYAPGNLWSLDLVASSGQFPATSKEKRGTELIGAKLMPAATAVGYELKVVDATNARNVSSPESSEAWDASGNTFLYRVKVDYGGSTVPTELCAQSAGAAGWAWAVPVSGLFDTLGDRQESTTAFTLGCEGAVIAKCYRWGYKPWMDGPLRGMVTQAHHACTRMARADYCGNGVSFTKDGTPIRPWDSLVPNVIAPPTTEASKLGAAFEAGWKTTGPSCLSHWRWQHLPAEQCVQLSPPIYGSDGGIVNDCRDEDNVYGPYRGDESKCSPICDNAGEAEHYYGSRVFNESASNVLDGGTNP